MRGLSLALFFFLTACSGSSGSSVTSTSSATPAADLSGAWTGTATALGQTISVHAHLEQDGTDVSGTMQSPYGCIGGGKIRASIAGDSVTGTVTSGDVVATLNLTVSSDDQLDGTFDLPPSGVCPAQQGSLSLARK
jgi:hypothetical protein